MKMDERDKQTLQENHNFLCQNVTYEDIRDHLISKKIISYDLDETFKKGENNRAQMRALLSYLPRCGPDKFEAFVSIFTEIDPERPDIAAKLCSQNFDGVDASGQGFPAHQGGMNAGPGNLFQAPHPLQPSTSLLTSADTLSPTGINPSIGNSLVTQSLQGSGNPKVTGLHSGAHSSEHVSSASTGNQQTPKIQQGVHTSSSVGNHPSVGNDSASCIPAGVHTSSAAGALTSTAYYSAPGNPPSVQTPPFVRPVAHISLKEGAPQGARIFPAGGISRGAGDVSDAGRIQAAPGFVPADYETVRSMQQGASGGTGMHSGFPEQETARAMGELTLEEQEDWFYRLSPDRRMMPCKDKLFSKLSTKVANIDQLGIWLGIDEGERDQIKQGNPFSIPNQVLELLTRWRKRTSGPSVEKLVKSLRDANVPVSSYQQPVLDFCHGKYQ